MIMIQEIISFTETINSVILAKIIYKLYFELMWIDLP